MIFWIKKEFKDEYINSTNNDGLRCNYPNCFKGIFTLDEFGNLRSFRDKEDVEKSWREFWGR